MFGVRLRINLGLTSGCGKTYRPEIQERPIYPPTLSAGLVATCAAAPHDLDSLILNISDLGLDPVAP